MIKNKKFMATGLALLALDQLAKYFLFNQSYLNVNFAWSWPIPNRLVVFLTVFLFLGIFYWRRRLPGASGAWWLVGAGAVSNLIDRLRQGGVVDYIWLPYGGVINLADIFIMIGVIWILCSRK